jgi:hypothetical protein
MRTSEKVLSLRLGQALSERLKFLLDTLHACAGRDGCTYAESEELLALAEAGVIETDGRTLCLVAGSPWWARRASLTPYAPGGVAINFEAYGSLTVEFGPPLTSSTWTIENGAVRCEEVA